MDAQTMSQLLLATMSPNPDDIKRAEAQLKTIKQNPGFAFNLLTLCNPSSTEKLSLDVAKAAAICFKNFVSLNWDPVASQEDRGLTPDCEIQPSERFQIKAGIVDFMCKVHPTVQKQLGEAVKVIAQSDWPDKWPELIPSLNQKLQNPQTPWPVLLGCLNTLNELFKRFRDAAQSDFLLLQLKTALDTNQQELFQLFCRLTQLLLQQQQLEGEVRESLLLSLRLCLRIFYSLNWQTIPEFFEDHIQQWMGEGQLSLLSLPPGNDFRNEETPSTQERVQHAVLENARLYAEKYAEEFAPYLERFLQQTFGLLVQFSPSTLPRHAELLMSGMRFVAVCISQPYNRKIFESEQTLRAILERIVIPNLTLSQVDLETFQDNPLEYLQRDMQGSDFETRRRVASEMIEKLSKQFPQETWALCQAYISQMLGQDWRAKDVAITLMIALNVERQTAREGATMIKNEPAMVQFLTQHLPMSTTADQQHPILVADTIKYVAIFRQFLPKDFVLSTVFPYLLSKLENVNQVCIHTYAASALDGLLGIRAVNKQYTQQEVAPFVQPLLMRLFNLMDSAQENYNEHVMKCVLRVINTSRVDVGPVVPAILNKLGTVLARVAANPSNPTFNHLLFETISALIRFGVETGNCTVTQLEQVVNPAFERILQLFIVEFIPYVLQIMAQMLRMGQTPPPHYLGIFPGLFSVQLWSLRPNVPALVILLQAFMLKCPQLFDASKQQELVQIISKLVSVRSTEEFGFDLARDLVAQIPGFQDVGALFQVGFGRIPQSKTMGKQLLGFTCVVVGKRGGAVCLRACDAFGAGTLERFVSQLLVPLVLSPQVALSSQSLKKLCLVGLTQLLVEEPCVVSAETWAGVACGLASLAVGATASSSLLSSSSVGVEVSDAVLESSSDATANGTFARLTFSLEDAHDDYFKEIGNASQHFVDQMKQKGLLQRVFQSLVSRNMTAVAQQLQAM